MSSNIVRMADEEIHMHVREGSMTAKHQNKTEITEIRENRQRYLEGQIGRERETLTRVNDIVVSGHFVQRLRPVLFAPWNISLRHDRFLFFHQEPKSDRN